MSDNKDGNPEAVNDAVFGSTDSFFDSLEDDVNGMVTGDAETETKATPEMDSTIKSQSQQEQVSQPQQDNVDWKKRYGDSSREAQRMKAELNDLKPFVPVLDAMKQDSGLVEHVRGYFQEGGNVPKNVKEQLKLDEDFQFDADEMVSNPESDSRKVFDTMVNGIVNKKADEIVQKQQQEDMQHARKERTRQMAHDFMKRSGMNEDQFADFVIAARERFNSQPLSFDDMYMLMNQQNVNKNVANATKEDMLSQMKNVRNMPTSQSGSNNAGDGKANPNDSIFDSLLDVDGNLDNMFG